MIKLVIDRLIMNIISVYAPQVGLDKEVKSFFWENLNEVVRGISDIKNICICINFNGHIDTYF